MTLLTWNHACTVGVRAMDDQHGILMDTMNDLRLALMRGSCRTQVCEILDRLIEFTRMHFHSEEQLLVRTGFPGLAAHRAEHRAILEHMQQAVQGMHFGEDAPLHPLLNGLRDRFLAHIEGTDQQYGPWLNARGVR